MVIRQQMQGDVLCKEGWYGVAYHRLERDPALLVGELEEVGERLNPSRFVRREAPPLQWVDEPPLPGRAEPRCDRRSR